MQEVKLTPFYWQGAANRGLNAPLALLPVLLRHLGQVRSPYRLLCDTAHTRHIITGPVECGAAACLLDLSFLRC